MFSSSGGSTVFVPSHVPPADAGAGDALEIEFERIISGPKSETMRLRSLARQYKRAPEEFAKQLAVGKTKKAVILPTFAPFR